MEGEVAEVIQKDAAVVGHCLHSTDVLILIAVMIGLRLEIVGGCFSKYNE